MYEKYPVLNSLLSFFRILAYAVIALSASLGLIVILNGLMGTQNTSIPYVPLTKVTAVIAGIGIIAAGACYGAATIAIVQFVRCIMEIEKNTRKEPPDPVVIHEIEEREVKINLVEKAKLLAEIPPEELIHEGLRRMEEEKKKGGKPPTP